MDLQILSGTSGYLRSANLAAMTCSNHWPLWS